MSAQKNASSRLRHRLTLQQETRTTDQAGGYTRGWQNVADLWAEITPLSGKEKLFAGQLQSEITHKIIVRYRSGVTAGMRFIYESRAFNIRYVSNVSEADEMLEILAQEGVGA